MATLVLAAGGGGDALGAMLAASTLQLREPLLIATLAWERLRIDPIPGPRGRDGFVGLREVAETAMEVLPTSETIPAGRSTLPRLARDSGARLFLIDPSGGAIGAGQQVRQLIRALKIYELIVFDVGGDVVARGDEAGLKSPAADALMLAAAMHSGVPGTVILAGPGLDAELAPEEVEKRASQLSGHQIGTVPPPPPALSRILDWHPTEATALLASAAVGVTGRVETRRGDMSLTVGPSSTSLWTTDLTATFAGSLYAQAVATTTRLSDVELACSAIRINEFAYERDKARAMRDSPDSRALDLDDRMRGAARAALERGAELITRRRLAELMNIRNREEKVFSQLLHSLRMHRHGWVWHLRPLEQLASPQLTS